MQIINLDLSRKGAYPLVEAKQKDIGRKFQLNLSDAGILYSIPEGSVFTIWYSGPSGEGNYSSIDTKAAFNFEVNSNTVVIELITQMLITPGIGSMCVTIENAGKQIGLWNLRYVTECIPGAGSSVAKQHYTTLFNAVGRAEAAADRAEELASSMNGTGDGTGGYKPPAGGIPITDLSQGVQSLLHFAGSAVQFADLNSHDTSDIAHNDIRIALQGLSDRVNAILDSDDTTLDQMSEIVAYIKSNKTLIDAITTSKVSITDIVNNLTTNLADRPLSAAQGVVLKAAIDELRSQGYGCLIVNATPTNLAANEYQLDRTPLDLCYAVTNNYDVRLHDTATGFLHHLVWANVANNMASVVFSGIEHGSGTNPYAVLYYVTPDGIATKTVTQIPSASDVLYSKDLTSAINTALAQAKDNGEFDGEPGENGGYYTIDVEQLNSQNVKLSFLPSKEGMETILPEVITLPQGPKGEPGAAGYSPVRGTDYWTSADIAQIKAYVDEAILGGAW